MKSEAMKNCCRCDFRLKLFAVLFILTLSLPLRQIRAFDSRKYLANEIIYQVVLDRFYDGNPQNNFFDHNINPSIKKDPDGLYDPSKHSMVSRFGGDLSGLIAKLPYLKELGVTVLWISPVFQNANELIPEEKGEYSFNTNYHGYWIEDWYEVDPHLKDSNQPGFQAVKELVKKAKSFGIKIMLDTVINHSNHYDVSSGRILKNGELMAETKSDIYKPLNERWFHHSGEIPLDYDCNTRDEETRNCRLANLADLNTENNPLVFDYLLNAHLELLKAGVYGFRVDTVPYVNERVLAKFEREIRKRYPKVVLVGEWFTGGPTKVASMGFYENTGYSMFNFDLRWVFEKGFVTDNEGYGFRNFKYLIYNVSDGFQEMYSEGFDPNDMVNFVDNHDVPRIRDLMEVEGMGEGDSKLASEASIAMLMTLPGVPCIFYGLEQGLHDHGVHEGERLKGGDPYNRSMMFLDDGTLAMRDDDLFSKTKELINLRKSYPVFRYGDFHNLDGELKREEGEGISLVSRERGIWVNKCGRDRVYGFTREDRNYIALFLTNVTDGSCTVWMDHQNMGLDPAHADLVEMVYPEERTLTYLSAKTSIDNPSIKRTSFEMAPFDYVIMVFEKGPAYVSASR